jgi:hypothetical protein
VGGVIIRDSERVAEGLFPSILAYFLFTQGRRAAVVDNALVYKCAPIEQDVEQPE